MTAHIKAGFDTYGIRKAVESGKADIGILDSLYLGTTNDDGTPLQVLQFSGSIGAGAQVSVLILTVGIEGGITLTVGFSWNDPTNDGKFRFGEFAKTALEQPHLPVRRERAARALPQAVRHDRHLTVRRVVRHQPREHHPARLQRDT